MASAVRPPCVCARALSLSLLERVWASAAVRSPAIAPFCRTVVAKSVLTKMKRTVMIEIVK